MYFFKYIILFLILILSTSIGFILAKQYSNRVNELKNILHLIKILQNKIRFNHEPLKDAFNDLSKVKTNKTISDIFLNFSQYIKNKKTEDAWNTAIDEKKSYLSLKEEDINLIKKLGNMLGKTDIEGQMNEINNFNTLIEIQIEKAEEEIKKNVKMYKSLGTILGIGIAILLI